MNEAKQNAMSEKPKNQRPGNQRLWNTLVEQVMRGNVIPVIGEEMTYVDNESPLKTVLEEVKDEYNVNYDNITSFTTLVNHLNVQAANGLYDTVADVIEEHDSLFGPSEVLKDLLGIKYFPFIITTTVYPTVERAMRGIYGEQGVRVLSFCNDSSNNRNDDIENSRDTARPTLYYMFGKANPDGNNYVLTDTDLLQFSRSWLQPTDFNNKSKPANLASALSNKFLLVLGNNFKDWLLRFFWLAMKNDSVFTNRYGKTPNGMEASGHADEQSIEFLNSSNIMTLASDLPMFVRTLKEQLAAREMDLRPDSETWFERPAVNADVFISYSRADGEIVEQLYKVLLAKGLNVWYDKRNLGAGDKFLIEIREAIRRCKLFVPVLTGNIRRQAGDMHVYRSEWRFAAERKEQTSSAIPFIIPLCEKSFDMYNYEADIPDAIKAHNAGVFSEDSLASDLEKFAEDICVKLKDRNMIINVTKQDRDGN